jgi:glycosyltransferase involved in cell wall biosynthesis
LLQQGIDFLLRIDKNLEIALGLQFVFDLVLEKDMSQPSIKSTSFAAGWSTRPLFSIVIPVYNRSSVIGHAIESVLAQTLQEFELIIVDDGSSDDLYSVVRSYNDNRIVLIRQENQGASAARNTGMDAARGEFVAFLDSDDRFMPHHLSAISTIVCGSQNLAAYSPVRVERNAGYFVKPSRAIDAGESMACYLMCDRGFVQTSGLVVPADAARAIRYREDVSFGDDTDFAIRLSLAGLNFVMTKTPSVVWSDPVDPARLSNFVKWRDNFLWLDDLRMRIPQRAYDGYRGWHVAKMIFHEDPLRSLTLYTVAVGRGAYSPKLAVIILLQIILKPSIYRAISDLFIRFTSEC